MVYASCLRLCCVGYLVCRGASSPCVGSDQQFDVHVPSNSSRTGVSHELPVPPKRTAPVFVRRELCLGYRCRRRLGRVRRNVLAAFEGILGEEIRPIDPNQVNYTIDLSVWWRPGEKLGELGATFHHVSRHLSDREKAFAIAWNFLGLQYVHTLEFGFLDLDFGGRGLWKLQRSFVDYAGEIGGYVEVTRPLAGRTSLMFGGEVTAVPVTQRLRNRDALMGSKIEAGVRFHGGRGVGEVFIARERRIDADPLDLNPTTFTMLGFRFLSQ